MIIDEIKTIIENNSADSASKLIYTSVLAEFLNIVPEINRKEENNNLNLIGYVFFNDICITLLQDSITNAYKSYIKSGIRNTEEIEKVIKYGSHFDPYYANLLIERYGFKINQKNGK